MWFTRGATDATAPLRNCQKKLHLTPTFWTAPGAKNISIPLGADCSTWKIEYPPVKKRLVTPLTKLTKWKSCIVYFFYNFFLLSKTFIILILQRWNWISEERIDQVSFIELLIWVQIRDSGMLLSETSLMDFAPLLFNFIPFSSGSVTKGSRSTE